VWFQYEARVGQQETLTRVWAERGTRPAPRATPATNGVEISRTVAEGAHAVLVLDGVGWHGSRALCIPKIIPYYAPELNLIENVWAYPRANRLAISVFEADEEVVGRCCDAWNFFANDIDTVRSITNRDYAKAARD